jgi:hypothetical protein
MEKTSIEKTGYWCSSYAYDTKIVGGTVTTKTRTKPKAKKQTPKRAKRVVDTSFAALNARYTRAVYKALQRHFAHPVKSFSGAHGLQYYPPECMVLDS